jgi:hypothetical protein
LLLLIPKPSEDHRACRGTPKSLKTAASIFLTLLLAALFGLFAAKLPNNAASPVLTVNAGVGAGPAGVQALLAVVVLHLVAKVMGLPARMKAAFHVPLLPSFL